MVIIQSVSRALSILSLYSYARPSLSIAEMTRALGLPKGTVYNLARTLEHEGFLRQDMPSRRYLLGPRVLALGAIMAGTLEINQMAANQIRRLADKLEMICRLAIWDNDAALVTLNAAPSYPEGSAGRIGPRVEAYCSSIGRLLLAYMEAEEVTRYLDRVKLVPINANTIVEPDRLLEELALIKKQGYALSYQEMAIGRASLAVPVRDSSGLVIAAMSVTGGPDRVDRDKVEPLLMELLPAADEVSRRMGHMPGTVAAARR